MQKNVKKLIIAVIVLAVTNLITGGWIVYDKYFNNSFSNDYPLIDVSRNFIPQEHFIVNLQPIREELRNLVAQEGPNSISLYFEFLNTGANISINPDLKIWPASLAKLPLALAVMKKVENGVWQLDNQLVLLEGDKDTESGTLFNHPVGTPFTIEELFKELLSNSDNTAYRILLRNMSTTELQPIIEEIGLDDFFDKEGKVSAKEYSRLFRTLYTSSFLKRENSSKILTWLSELDFHKFLASGIDGKTTFAHKWGANRKVHVFADSGIVYVPNRPYIITVMIQSDGTSTGEQKAEELMQKISSSIYQYVLLYKN